MLKAETLKPEMLKWILEAGCRPWSFAEFHSKTNARG
jgi:hypothetical protein